MPETIAGDERLLRCGEVASILRVGEDTLSLWRRTGSGPVFLRYGARCVRYRRRDVRAWLSQQEVKPAARIVGAPQAGIGQYLRNARALRPDEQRQGASADESRERGRS